MQTDKDKRRQRISVVDLLKLFIGLGLLTVLLIWNDNGRQALALLSDFRPILIFPLIALSLILNGISALKWHFLLMEQRNRVSFWRLYVLYLIGKFFNNFVPSMIGGDVTRIFLLGRDINSHSHSAASVVMERLTGLITLIALAVIFSLVNPSLLIDPSLGMLIALISAAGLALIGLLFNPDWLSFIYGRLASVKLASSFVKKLKNVHHEIALFRNRYRTLTLSVLCSIAFYGTASLSIYLSCVAIGYFPDFLNIALITPVIFLLTVVPVSPNNIGWWEWCFSVLIASTGGSMAEGLMAALIMRAIALFTSLLGGILFLFERNER